MYQIQAKHQNRWTNWVQAQDYAAAVTAANRRFAQYNHKHSFRVVSPSGEVVYRMAA